MPTPQEHVHALRRALEIVEEGCTQLTKTYPESRRISHVGSQTALAYQIGKPAGEQTVGMVLFTCRLDPRGYDLIVECTVELDHSTVRQGDDTCRVPIGSVDDGALLAFVRSKEDKFQRALAAARSARSPDES